MSFKTDKKREIDGKKLNRIRYQVYHLERENLKKERPLGPTAMIERIIKIIEEEVKKCY